MKSEIDQLRQQLNDMRRRHPDDPHLAERIGQIRENLALGMLKLAAKNVAALDQYMKEKRER